MVPELLTNFSPGAKPVILHGDLWSGNIATNANTGEPILFDMSSYYGHNEADFGISHMFSSLTPAFYDKYHSILPKSEPSYNERMKLYELYHHLNHYLMFGVRRYGLHYRPGMAQAYHRASHDRVGTARVHSQS